MNFFWGGGKTAAKPELDKRTQSIQELKRVPGVQEVQANVSYALPFRLSNGSQGALSIALSPNFPSDPPQLTTNPQIGHEWAIGPSLQRHPKMQNWNMHTSLAQMIADIDKEFRTRPPIPASQVLGPAVDSNPYTGFGYPSTGAGYPPAAAAGGWNPYPTQPGQPGQPYGAPAATGGAPGTVFGYGAPQPTASPATARAQEDIYSRFGYASGATAAHTQPAPAPASTPASRGPTGMEGITMSGISMTPAVAQAKSKVRTDVPTRFPELEGLTNSELERYMNDPVAFQEMFNSLEPVKNFMNFRLTLKESNEELAKGNLNREAEVNQAQQRLSEVHASIASKRAQLEQLAQRQEAIMQRYSPAALAGRMGEAVRDADNQSDAIRQRFQDGQLNGTEFIRQYTAARKLYHVRAAKKEKLDRSGMTR